MHLKVVMLKFHSFAIVIDCRCGFDSVKTVDNFSDVSNYVGSIATSLNWLEQHKGEHHQRAEVKQRYRAVQERDTYDKNDANRSTACHKEKQGVEGLESKLGFEIYISRTCVCGAYCWNSSIYLPVTLNNGHTVDVFQRCLSHILACVILRGRQTLGIFEHQLQYHRCYRNRSQCEEAGPQIHEGEKRHHCSWGYVSVAKHVYHAHTVDFHKWQLGCECRENFSWWVIVKVTKRDAFQCFSDTYTHLVRTFRSYGLLGPCPQPHKCRA